MKSRPSSIFFLFVELITIFILCRRIVGRYHYLQRSDYIIAEESDKCRIRYYKTGIDNRIIQYQKKGILKNTGIMKSLDFTWPFYDTPEETRLSSLFNVEKNHISHLGNVNELLQSYITNEYSEMKLNTVSGKTLTDLINKQGDMLYYSCRDSRLYSHCQHHYLATYVPQKKKWQAYEKTERLNIVNDSFVAITKTKKFDVTLIVHFTLDQNNHIPTLLSRWEGPAVLVVVASLDEMEEVDQFAKSITSNDVMIHAYIRQKDVYNNCDDNYIVNINKKLMFKDCYIDPIYPINLLRAIGVNSILTTHYTVIDVDLLVSQSLRTNFKKIPKPLLMDPKVVFMYPTFTFDKQTTETCLNKNNCHKLWENIPKKKKGMINMLQANKTHLMDATSHQIIHTPSWMDSKENVVFLNCLNSTFMEPYFIAKRDEHMINYNPYFVNYGFDKVALFMQLRQEGYKFGVLMQDFGFDTPHKESRYSIAYKAKGKKNRDIMYKMASIYKDKLIVSYKDALPVCSSI